MKKLMLLLLIVLLSVSCNDNANRTEVKEMYAVNSRDYSPPRALRKSANENIQTAKVEYERKLIKNGRLSFKTDSISTTKKQITQLVNTYKGYISSDNTNRNPTQINQYLTIRIPTENFDPFISELSKGVKEFDFKEIKVSDVTEQFYDLQTRLKTKKELEKRYLQILAKARSVKEILEVEKQLGAVREEIESTEGRLKYLSNQVSFSTINLTFYEELPETTVSENKFVKAFFKGIEGVKSFILFVISVWPFVILLFLVYFVVSRKFKKRS